MFRPTLPSLLVFGVLMGGAHLPAMGQNDAPPSFPEDVGKTQIAIEAMVIEINADRTRDVGIQYGYNRDETGDAGGILNPLRKTEDGDADSGDSGSPNNVIEGVTTAFPLDPQNVLVPVFTDVGTLGGYSLGQVSRSAGVGASFVGLDVGSVGVISGRIRALVDQGDAEVRTRPIIVTLHGQKASITTANEVPYQIVRYDKGQSFVTVAYRQVGVILNVTPSIIEPVEKQMVEIDIEKLEVSSVQSYVTVGNVTRPTFATSNAETKVRLHSAETLIIGGMKSKREVVQENRIPILGRIPFLGWLFKNQKREIQETDVLFFLTPYILKQGVNPILPFDFSHNEVLAPDLPAEDE